MAIALASPGAEVKTAHPPWPANTKGTLNVDVPPDAGNFQLFMLAPMQLERPGKSFSLPLAEADSTLPLGPMVMLPLTRALFGALGDFASSAGCQHLRLTRGVFDAMTPWTSPAESCPPLVPPC